MSEQLTELEQTKAEYIEKLRKVKLVEAGVDIGDVDIYVKYISADDSEGIEKEVQEIVADIEQHNTATDVYHDKRAWKPF